MTSGDIACMAQNSLQDKVCLVTGGGAGIGAAIVALFLSHGAKVACIDIAEPKKPETDSQLNLQYNIAIEEEAQSAVNHVHNHFGQLDVLVNCAGIMDNFARIADTPTSMWRSLFAVNVDGPMFLIRASVPHFLAQPTKGAIVNLCSAASVRGSAAGCAYTATKHALLGVSRSTAWSYAKDGVRCNAVLPGGVIDTRIMADSKFGIDEGGSAVVGFDSNHSKCAPGYCTPEQIANAVLFLATAPSVNGAELTVDRGWLVS